MERCASTHAKHSGETMQKHDVVSGAATSMSPFSSGHPGLQHPSMNHSQEGSGNILCNRVCPDDVDLGIDENTTHKDSFSCQAVTPRTPNTDLYEDLIFKQSLKVALRRRIDPAITKKNARSPAILDLKPYVEMALKMKEEGVESDVSDSSDESSICSEEDLREQ